MILKEKIKELRARFDEELAKAGTPEALESLRVAFLGKKGPVTDLMAGILHLHVYITPPSPAQEVVFTLEYDVSYVQSALAS